LELINDQLPLDQRAVRIGLQDAVLPGRFQLVGRDPITILDVGHNVQAMETLSGNLGDLYCSGRTFAVFSMLSDKQIEASVNAIKTRVDEWFVGELAVPRAESSLQLSQRLEATGVEPQYVQLFAGVKEAYKAAAAKAEETDRIVVFGSFYTVAEVRELIDSPEVLNA